MFCVHTKTESQCFQISSVWKLRFRDGFVWMVGLTVEMMRSNRSSLRLQGNVSWCYDEFCVHNSFIRELPASLLLGKVNIQWRVFEFLMVTCRFLWQWFLARILLSVLSVYLDSCWKSHSRNSNLFASCMHWIAAEVSYAYTRHLMSFNLGELTKIGFIKQHAVHIMVRRLQARVTHIQTANEYIKDHIILFELRRNIWIYDWSSIKQLWN